jgi:hypothetical protein
MSTMHLVDMSFLAKKTPFQFGTVFHIYIATKRKMKRSREQEGNFRAGVSMGIKVNRTGCAAGADAPTRIGNAWIHQEKLK